LVDSYIEFEEFDEEGRGDTLLEKIIDEYMELNNEICANDIVLEVTNEGDNNEEDDDMAILIILILLCIAICFIICGALIYRKMNKNESKRLRQLSGSSPVSTKEVELDDAEPELEVSMERDGETGAIITYDYH